MCKFKEKCKQKKIHKIEIINLKEKKVTPNEYTFKINSNNSNLKHNSNIKFI